VFQIPRALTTIQFSFRMQHSNSPRFRRQSARVQTGDSAVDLL
jgi:hypothetical protein